MRTYTATAALFFVGSCVVASDEEFGVAESESTSTNGRSLNGTSLNGISLNGISLNGVSLNGVSLNGVSLNGSSLNGVTLSGSQLTGTSDTGGSVFGSEWGGATMNGVLSDGSPLTLRIDAAVTLAGPNADVWVYDVKYALNDGSWSPLCNGNTAVALSGTWNYASGVAGGGGWIAGPDVTFGCRGTALAKCVELGYKPWQTVGGKSLRDYHQACTRMIRADYCGDGTANTFDGWQLNVFDNLNIQTRAPGLDSWGFEARWAPSGALCMSSYRALDLIVSTELPSCVAERIDSACAAGNFVDLSLVQNYFDPWGINVALQDAYARYPRSRSDLEGAHELIDHALRLLAEKKEPKPRDVAQKIEQAVTKIKSALTKDLPASFGNNLMRRYAQLVRSSLVYEIDKKVAIGTPASKLANARKNLADGDALMNKTPPDYPNAVNRYKNGIGSL